MNQPEQPIITLLAEGGSIILFKTNETFYFYTSEILEDDEDFKVKKVPQSFLSFSKAFIALQNKYPIFNLHLDEVHDDFKIELKTINNILFNDVHSFSESWGKFLEK